jgi:hypothetical protein
VNGQQVVTVDAHEVQAGDVVFGRQWTPVERVVFRGSDGDWLYLGRRHGGPAVPIRTVPLFGRVQVIRQVTR